MNEPCKFCQGPVNPYDISSWKHVDLWEKNSGETAMERVTGEYAHDSCVHVAHKQPPDQGKLF